MNCLPVRSRDVTRIASINAREIESVTLEQMKKTFRKWISPDGLVTVLAGAVPTVATLHRTQRTLRPSN
jgi:predicted Zn-dependent peptidase